MKNELTNWTFQSFHHQSEAEKDNKEKKLMWLFPILGNADARSLGKISCLHLPNMETDTVVLSSEGNTQSYKESDSEGLL